MPALIRLRRRRFLVGPATAVVVALLQVPAQAGGGGGLGTQGGGKSDGTIWASAGVQYNTDNNGSPTNGHPVAKPKAAGNWKPPPCWYEPYYTAAQFKAASEQVWSEQSPSWEWISKQKNTYFDGHPYTNFNMAKADQGYWWWGYAPDLNVPGADACSDEPFWVDKGAPVPTDHANVPTPEELAQLAYNEILIPTGSPTTNPTTTQAVNLPTWVWFDAKDIHPVSVTAYLPDYNVSATTTATPVGIHIDPGTPDARLFPSSGDCTGTGTAYQPGDKGDPPCGVTYLKDSHGGQYTMTVTVTWHISWKGTGNTGGDLPTGTFPHDQNVTVREIQSVNR